MALESLRELFLRELCDLYGAETRILKTLPNMVKAASTPVLKQAFEQHRSETEQHILRLDRCFTALRIPARGVACRGMEGLVSEAQEMMDEEGPDPVVDAGLIGVAQRMEHYEIAAYGSAITFATRVGEMGIAAVLRETLAEEMAMDWRLTGLALGEVNDTAMAVGTRISES